MNAVDVKTVRRAVEGGEDEHPLRTTPESVGEASRNGGKVVVIPIRLTAMERR
jgi:hypothetical protein